MKKILFLIATVYVRGIFEIVIPALIFWHLKTTLVQMNKQKTFKQDQLDT